MPDRQFEEPALAALYDLFCPSERRGDFGFYLPLISSARSVLDVGCGTGSLLRMARERGHAGRLTGLDPALGMLEQARKRSDIEWVQGDLASASWAREFDLVVMSGHAFQVLVEDHEIRTALAAIRTAFTDEGRFAFETRNPLDRAWERWSEEYSGAVTDETGVVFRSKTEVHLPVEGDTVSFSRTIASSGWSQPEASHSTLRFLDTERLSAFLADAGLTVEQQFGEWDRSPLTDASREIITIARRA